MTRVHHLTSISGRQRGTTLSLFFVREDRGSKTDGPTYGQLQRSMATRCSGAAEPRPPAPRRQRGARRRLRVAAGSGPAWLPARVTPPPHTAPTNRRPRHGGRFKGAAPSAAPTCRRELPACLPACLRGTAGAGLGPSCGRFHSSYPRGCAGECQRSGWLGRQTTPQIALEKSLGK